MPTTQHYTIDEHRHRFALWAAARAAQRGLKGGSNAALASALEKCGVVDVVRAPAATWPGAPAAFDAVHEQWCIRVVAELEARGVATSFGRAAKLIAIYLKTVVVAAGFHDSALARTLHPPIDDILLSALASDPTFTKPSRQLWKQTRWTRLDRNSYAELIRSLRGERLDTPAFWMIERYWRVTGHGDA
jgi:hypothetical protein